MPVPPTISHDSIAAVVRLLEDFQFTVDGELMTTETERESNVFVRLVDTKTTSGTYYYGLIDLSDTTNWPHSDTGRIDISSVGLGIDKASSARGVFSLGVVVRVDGADADIELIAGFSFKENATSSIFETFNYAPAQLKCSVSNGRTDRIKTNSLLTGVTAINTAGGDLAFNGENFVPAVGDIVLVLEMTANGDLSFGIQIGYHANA